MKIFALNLCLSFEVGPASPQIPEYISLAEASDRIRVSDLRQEKRSIFYISGGEAPGFPEELFAFQQEQNHREAHAELCILFPDKKHRKAARKAYKRLFKRKDAAGGLTLNESEEALFIFTRNRWSLPKGHLEGLESPHETAVREVQEETGLVSIELSRQLPSTFHTFCTPKGKWILKKTYWYQMFASSKQSLLPQAEEYIEAVSWISRTHWHQGGLNTYPLTQNILKEHWLPPTPIEI